MTIAKMTDENDGNARHDGENVRKTFVIERIKSTKGSRDGAMKICKGLKREFRMLLEVGF